MKRLTNILCIVLTVWYIVSCSKPDDYFSEKNQKPVIKIRKAGSVEEFQQSLRDTMKFAQENVEYEISIENDDSGKTLYIETEDGRASYKGNLITYTPDMVGEHTINIITKDYYNSQSNPVEINLYVFENMSPVSIFNFEIDGNFIQIDASESYDRDFKYGGEIKYYKYNINGVSYGPIEKSHFEQYINLLDHNSVSVSVIDNDNIWSYSEIETF